MKTFSKLTCLKPSSFKIHFQINFKLLLIFKSFQANLSSKQIINHAKLQIKYITNPIQDSKQHILQTQHLAHSTNPFGLTYPKFSIFQNKIHNFGLTYPKHSHKIISKTYHIIFQNIYKMQGYSLDNRSILLVYS